jgi:hypothetical protein
MEKFLKIANAKANETGVVLAARVRDEKEETREQVIKRTLAKFVVTPARLLISKGKVALPRSIPVWPIMRVVLRFSNTAACPIGNGLIYADDIFGAIGVYGRVTNTSVTPIATSFRIRKVTMYVAPSSSGAVLAHLVFLDTADRVPDTVSNDAMPPTYYGEPYVLVGVPPKNSSASLWYKNTGTFSTAIFGVDVSTTGTVLDLELDFTLSSDVAASDTITVATAVVGKFYRLPLNKTSTSGGILWNPVTVSSTI